MTIRLAIIEALKNICKKQKATKEQPYEINIEFDGTMGLSELQKMYYKTMYVEDDTLYIKTGNLFEDSEETNTLDNYTEEELEWVLGNLMDDMDENDIFNICANRSIPEIKTMVEGGFFQCSAIRYYFSRLLMNYPDEDPMRLETPIWINELQIIALSQTPCEGYINILQEGCYEWDDLDILEAKEQIMLLERLA